MHWTVFKMGKRQEVNVFWSLGTSLYIYAGTQCNNVFRSWDGAAQRTLNPSINVLLQAFWLFASLFLLCSGLLRPLAVNCLLTTPYFPWLFVWIIGLWEVDPKEKHLNKTLKDFSPHRASWRSGTQVGTGTEVAFARVQVAMLALEEELKVWVSLRTAFLGDKTWCTLAF